MNKFQAAANLDLGLRAGQKLREMARREEEEEVKTKVSPMLTIKQLKKQSKTNKQRGGGGSEDQGESNCFSDSICFIFFFC